ncbi:MAG: hypothetical protein ACKO2N_03390 [Tabrizicola sp.]
MLQIAAKLPPGALIGGDEHLLAEAVLRTGGARFVARDIDMIRSAGKITGWREQYGAIEAVVAGPNSGNSRHHAGPPEAVVFQEGLNCGFTLPRFAPEVEAFTVAIIYRSEGEAKTLASVFTGQANNMIFLTENDGVLLAKDRENTLEVSVPVPRGGEVKLALLGFAGQSLCLKLGDRVAEARGIIPGLQHPADFFIGCRSNRAGLGKTLGQSLVHEVLFWPDRCLPGSEDAEDRMVLSRLTAHVRWTY